MAKRPIFTNPELQALYESLGLDKPAPPKSKVTNPYAGNVVNPYATLNMGKIPEFVAADKVAEKTLKSGKKLSPELERLAAQVEKQKYQAKMYGGKNSKTHHPSALERVIDVLSRGNYAVANAFLHGQKAAEKQNPNDTVGEVLHGLAAMPEGFVKGLTGKEKTRFHDVLNEDAKRHGQSGNGGWGRAGKAFVMDVALDPINFVTPAIVGKGIRLAGKGATKAGRAAKAAEDTLHETRGFNRTWSEEAAKFAETGKVPAERVAQAGRISQAPLTPTSLPDWTAAGRAASSKASQPVKSQAVKDVEEAIAVAEHSVNPATALDNVPAVPHTPGPVKIDAPVKRLNRAAQVKERSQIIARAQHEERLLTARKASTEKAIRDNIIPGKKGMPVKYTREARVWVPMAEVPEHLKNLPYRRLEGVPQEQLDQARNIAFNRTAIALQRKVGRKVTRTEIEESPEYRKLYTALVEERAAKHGQRISAAASKQPYVHSEQFPLAELNDVHPTIREMAEDEVRIEFEKKAFRANPVADAKVGKEMIRVPGSKLFDELTPAEQLKLMTENKPKYVKQILKAQKEHGLLDEKFMPVSAEQTAAHVEKELAKPALATGDATAATPAAQAVAEPEKAVLDKVEKASKPAKKKKIKDPVTQERKVADAYAKPLDEFETGLVQQISKAISDDLASHVEKFGKSMAPNNAYKILARRNTISEALTERAAEGKNWGAGMRQRYKHTAGHQYRVNALLLEASKKAFQDAGHYEIIHPLTGKPIDLFEHLDKIPYQDLYGIDNFQNLLKYDFSKASTAADAAVDTVAKAAANPEITSNEVVDLVNATKQGVEEAVAKTGAPASAARAAGNEAAREADKMRVVDDAQAASVQIGKDSAAQWGISPGLPEGTAKRLEQHIVAQQEAVYRYIGIRVSVGGDNPLLEIPLIKISSRGAKQAKQAQSVTKAAIASAKAERDYNSLLDAVRATPKALRIMFDNSYGMGSRVHEVMQTFRGSYASRRAQEAHSISELTKGMKQLDRSNAFRHAQQGKSYPVGDVDLGDLYAKYMDHLLDVTNEGSVVRLAGLSMDEVKDQLKYIRPRPTMDPLVFPENSLDWRKLELPDGLDPNHAAMAVADAVQKAVAMKHANGNLKALFGVSNVSNPLEYTAAKAAGFAEVKGRPELAGYIFPEEVVPQIHRMYQVLDELRESNLRGVHPVLRLYDLVLGKWKAGVTVYNPAFHLRNMMGDMFTGYLDGVGARAYSKSARVMSYRAARNGEQLDDWLKTAGGLDRRVIYDQFNPNRVIRSAEDAASQPTIITQIGKHNISAEDYMSQYLNRGIRQEIAQAENLAADEVASQRITQRLANNIRNASEKREDFARMAHFIHATERALRKGKPLDEAFSEAAALSKKFHADYNDLTPFEQRVMKRVIPFYTWQRRTMPVLLESMLTKPGKMTVYPKFMSSLSQAMGFDPGPQQGVSFPNIEAVVPDWMHSNMMWPMAHHGENVVYMDPSNPFNDMYKQTLNGLAAGQPVKTFMQQTTPFARVPLELSTGRQFFGAGSGIPIDNKATYLDTQTPLLNILSRITNISPAATVENARHGDLGLARNPKVPASGDEAGINNVALLNTLLAAGGAENTQRRQKGELRRQQDISTVDKKKAREDYYNRYGFPVPKRGGGR